MQKRLMNLLTFSNDGHWEMGEDGKVTFFNSKFYEKFGLTTAELSIDAWMERIHPDDKGEFIANTTFSLSDIPKGSKLTTHYRITDQQGTYHWIESAGTKVCEEDNTYIIGYHRDISDQKVLEDRVDWFRYYDADTGLANIDKLLADITQTGFGKNKKALAMFGLGTLRALAMQHDFSLVGQVIKHLIGAINEVFEPHNAQLYRMALDTLVVFVPESDLSDNQLVDLCRETSLRLQRFLAQKNVPGDNMLISGALHYQSKVSEASEILHTLSRVTDYASHAKTSNFVVLNDEVNRDIERFYTIKKDLSSAIDNGDVYICLQPIVNAQTKKIQSFEALARWKHPILGDIYPDEFIPLAEQSELIHSLGKRVFLQACEFIYHYNQRWNSDVKVNINISVLQLYDEHFIQEIKSAIERLVVQPQFIVLELTESVLLESDHMTRQTIRDLVDFGFSLAMDDFGTGYSSLISFFNYPFDQIKIDKALADEAMKSEELSSYLDFLTNLCRNKNIKVTVEGIETGGMSEKFSSMGATTLQGYLFAKPLDEQEALNTR